MPNQMKLWWLDSSNKGEYFSHSTKLKNMQKFEWKTYTIRDQ
jgi:hypothetical protein